MVAGAHPRAYGYALALLALVAAPTARGDASSDSQALGNAVSEVLGAAPEGFARATSLREFRFPEDHGPHPQFRSEWWYFTGNVASTDGRRFGFQLTFFRFALMPAARERASAWASTQVYMAHFAVSDVAAGRFHAAEAFSREALDLAGSRAAPFKVWLGTWRAVAGGELFPLALEAEDGGYAIDLRLDAGKPVVLNGEGGLSRKSSEPGNASYYYSIPRMPVSGRIATPEGDWRVSGSAWLDREWSSSALGAHQVGWDWFALQLSDGRDLMVYRLRNRDGSADPASAGTLVESDGRARALDADDFTLEVLEHWSSPRGDARYPARWRLQVPSAAIDVEVTPEIPNQELDLTFRYFEGASRVSGTSASLGVTGHGYVELTGYASGRGSLAR